MFWEIFTFEIKTRLKRPMVWIFFAVFFALTFAAITTDAVRVGSAIGNVHRNAPFVILQMLGTMSILGMFLIPAFISTALIRDFELGTDSTFFTTPISKFDYLMGRFAGGVVVSFIAISGTAFGLLVGSWMPWLDPARIGEFMLAPYLYGALMIALPNIIVVGAICFALAVFTRSMLYTYVGIIAVFVGFAITGNLLSDVENQVVAALLDPFASGAMDLTTRYWTSAEKNALVPPLVGWILYNRLLWAGVSLILLALSIAKFQFSTERKPLHRHRQSAKPVIENEAFVVFSPAPISQVTQTFSLGLYFRQFLSQTKLEFISIIKSVPYLVVMIFGLINLIAGLSLTDQLYGTAVYPVTRLVLNVIDGNFALFMLIIITFYTGELVWKERQIKLNVMYDALPLPDWVPFGSKFTALVLVVGFTLLVVMCGAMGAQLYRGYTHFEPALYAKGLFLHRFSAYILLCALAMFFHVWVNNKYMGYMLMVLYYILMIVLQVMGWDHNLYRYGLAPEAPYSDMNGYGHFVVPLVWFRTYWSLFAVMLMVSSLWFWVRGTEDSLRARLKQAKARLSPPTVRVFLLALSGFILVGSYIFYNTNLLNDYSTRKQREKRRAEYEKTYKKYENLPQPTIAAVQCSVDIYPQELRLDVRGTYGIINKTTSPIDTVLVQIETKAVQSMAIPNAHIIHQDNDVDYLIYRIDPPMPPGDSVQMHFDLRFTHPGFVNSGSNTDIVYNGTFINNYGYFPHFGYDPNQELADKNDRKKYGLPPKNDLMASLTDTTARQQNYITQDADWVTFETTVSTDAGQIAIAPGYLQYDWQEGARHYFHYQMDAPILNFYSFLSADYAIKRDKWHDVNIEIYYDPKHPYNVDRMIEAIQKSFDYYTVNFGPYQHRQARILEFPGYARFAQSFPNTIPYSEGLGFIARLKDESAIDYVFYVTAHEIAHQWWAHQVVSANVEGATVMSETMSQYAALMVMEKEYGAEKMRRFLRYELDQYLQGRSGELLKEMPLYRVGSRQGYIHYRKGSLVMYALKDYIGEANLNRALKDYVTAVKFQKPPYTTSTEFLSYIEAATPDSLKYIIDDMFRTITLYENKTGAVTYYPREDGKYQVTVEVEAKKIRADSLGNETEIPINDWIDIGVFAGEGSGENSLWGEVLYLEKHKIDQPQMMFEIVVDQEPSRAGIDPLNKLIDRQPDDNTKKATSGGDKVVLLFER